MMKTPEEVIRCQGRTVEAADVRVTAWPDAKKIIAALDAAGYVIVPKEPTKLMADHGNAAAEKFGLLPAYTGRAPNGQESIFRYMLRTASWPAMIAAAQTQERRHRR